MKVATKWAQEETDEEGDGKKRVHISAPGITCLDTLCGHVDRTSFNWQEGGRSKVNCRSCLAIWKFVKDHTL